MYGPTKTPKSMLLELCQAYGVNPVSVPFIVNPSLAGFRCTIHLPSLGRTGPQEITAEGKNKKAAEHAAAACAMELLSGRHRGTLEQNGAASAGPMQNLPLELPNPHIQQLSAGPTHSPGFSGSHVSMPQQNTETAKLLAVVGEPGHVRVTGNEMQQQQEPCRSSSSRNPAAVLLDELEGSEGNIIDSEAIMRMSEQEAKLKLREALQEILELKAAAEKEKKRKKFAAEVLLTVGPGSAAFDAAFPAP